MFQPTVFMDEVGVICLPRLNGPLSEFRNEVFKGVANFFAQTFNIPP